MTHTIARDGEQYCVVELDTREVIRNGYHTKRADALRHLREIDETLDDDLTLTRREREVSFLLIGGFTNKEIARILIVSQKTVESHVRHIFYKLNASTRAGVLTSLLTSGHIQILDLIPVFEKCGEIRKRITLGDL